LHGEECVINGDGTITRDFCPVEDVVQANILAAISTKISNSARVFNVGSGITTSLNQLYKIISQAVTSQKLGVAKDVHYNAAREGDILHSTADISLIRKTLGYKPSENLDYSITETVSAYAVELNFVPVKSRGSFLKLPATDSVTYRN
jgi:UDP-N-acetylglucosamine 4-epimerase